jgi:hypothetical protein
MRQSLGCRSFRHCANRIKPRLCTGIIEVCTWRSSNTNPSDYFTAEFDWKPAPKDQYLIVHVAESL